MSPGWLKDWRCHLELWGFDQPTAQRFFNECASKLTLLDTDVIANSEKSLKEMGEYLNLPVQSIPVGIDHFRLMLNNIIQSWRLSKVSIKSKEEIRQANRKLADYAMAMNLMSKLTMRRSETDTVKAIFDIFMMLFGAKKIFFVPIIDGEIGEVKSNISEGVDRTDILKWVDLLGQKDHIVFDDKFAVKVKDSNEIVGMVVVDSVGLPQYINEYINLAIGIAPMCSLVLHNVKIEQERLSLQAIIQHNQKLDSVGSLANGVAHEINNPINGVMNYAQLIYDRIDKDDELSIYAAEIINETERVTKIVRNLLNYSHVDSHLQSMINVSDIIDDSLSLMTNLLMKEYIILKINPPANLPMVMCNKQQIQQILINLMTNARDSLNLRYPAYDDNKWLTMHVSEVTRDDKPYIEIIIEDTGNGINDDIKNRIFDPFFTTKSRASNAGLGLFISRSLILENYGEITFDSEPGQGAKFYVYLPVATE
jgi:signal transduction histidine kinase